jgi:outer membrane lipoprotein SlyB
MRPYTAICVLALSLATTAQATDNAAVGTLLGAVAGGVLGNQVGKGDGRVLATGFGALLGASAGNAIGARMDAQDRYRYPYASSDFSPWDGRSYYDDVGDRYWSSRSTSAWGREQRYYRPYRVRQSGPGETWGTLFGGAAGGILGNQIGRGDGRAVATILGTIVGATAGNAVGRYVDAPPQPYLDVPQQYLRAGVPPRYTDFDAQYSMQGYQRGPSSSIYVTPFGYPVR